jgi:hypothetical protein
LSVVAVSLAIPAAGQRIMMQRIRKTASRQNLSGSDVSLRYTVLFDQEAGRRKFATTRLTA